MEITRRGRLTGPILSPPSGRGRRRHRLARGSGLGAALTLLLTSCAGNIVLIFGFPFYKTGEVFPILWGFVGTM